MERSEVSRHEVLVFRSLTTDRWVSSSEVAESTGVSPRTARAHLLKLVQLGVADQAEVFPGHRYRLAEFAVARNRGYVDRLDRAAEALGISA